MTENTKNQGYQPDPSNKANQARFYEEWFADHEDELAERNRELELAALGKNAAYAAKHRAKLLNAIPPWVDLVAVERLYTEAAVSGMHVDHIYPLQGEAVCGLHVANNLRLLTPLDNLKKGNKVSADLC